MKRKKGVTRTRNYATIVYPESAAENWLEKLRELRVNVFVSPLHDKDKKEDGTQKKQHYHVMVMFDSPKTVDQAADVFGVIGGVGVEIIQSRTAYARYLCHLDDDDKEKYEIEKVIEIGAVSYRGVICTKEDEFETFCAILDIINANDLVYYSDLIDICRATGVDFLRIASGKTIFFTAYLKSLEYKKRRGEEK